MKDGVFERGDIICGIADNGYVVTNEDMFEALVVCPDTYVEYEMTGYETNRPETSEMTIKVLRHSDKDYIGEKFDVHNSTRLFRLVPEIDYSVVKSERELKEFLLI